ncbi:MAG: amino acid ABC transporter permease [Rhodobacteraceae bacterium]|nr:amino acid ABC transporter permease [Paracoccaceae bacterium]
MEQLIQQFFNVDLMIEAAPLLLQGLGTTLLLCLAVVPLGLAGGLGVALAGTSRMRWLRIATMVFVDFFRAIPPLVLLIFVYSGLPFAGVQLDPFSAVCIAFLLNNSAYYGEIFRAGIESIGGGQRLAARSTGLSAWQSMRYVVLPQATRNVLPDLMSNTVEVVKLTSLASVVSLQELLYSADMARSITYNASPIVLAALMYLALLWPMIRLVARFERRLGASAGI